MTDTHTDASLDQTATSTEVRPSDLVRDTLPEGDLGAPGSAAPSMEDLTEAMKDVVDPELGINVVDLGLVYGLHLDEGNALTIDMTLTSAACPLTDVIEDQTNQALEGLVSSVTMNWVWMPPWGLEKITEDGRDQLRALGFNV
jgi:metal-sulfur cluster biosynthetic enzyme